MREKEGTGAFRAHRKGGESGGGAGGGGGYTSEAFIAHEARRRIRALCAGRSNVLHAAAQTRRCGPP